MDADPSFLDFRRELGARVKRLRRDRGLTQEQLSELIGFAPQTLRRIESGRSNARLPSLFALAQHLGVSVAELFGDAHAPLPPLPRGQEEGLWLQQFRATPEELRPLLMNVLRQFSAKSGSDV